MGTISLTDSKCSCPTPWGRKHYGLHMWPDSRTHGSLQNPGITQMHAPQQNLHIGFPLERVTINFFGPFPKTSPLPRGHKYILVATYCLTKLQEAFLPLSQEMVSMTQTSWWMDSSWKNSTPMYFHSYQSTQFMSWLFQDMCNSFQISVSSHYSEYW